MYVAVRRRPHKPTTQIEVETAGRQEEDVIEDVIEDVVVEVADACQVTSFEDQVVETCVAMMVEQISEPLPTYSEDENEVYIETSPEPDIVPKELPKTSMDKVVVAELAPKRTHYKTKSKLRKKRKTPRKN